MDKGTEPESETENLDIDPPRIDDLQAAALFYVFSLVIGTQ
jgi:hypothetical protein